MVRPSFIKGLKDEELTLWEIIYEGIWYCKPMIFLRKIGRFLKALPDYIKICWNNEDWDYEGIYNFIEMYLKRLRKCISEDTWHTEHCVKREIQQIDLVLAHLDRYRNWPNYYEWPEPIHQENENGTYSIIYREEDKPKCELVHKMETKHYEAFWRLFKKYHSNWWT